MLIILLINELLYYMSIFEIDFFILSLVKWYGLKNMDLEVCLLD